MSKLINIKTPLYIIDGELYNEYEIRAICLMIAEGKLSSGIVIVDMKGDKFEILPDGRIDFMYGGDRKEMPNLPAGMELCSHYRFELARLKNSTKV